MTRVLVLGAGASVSAGYPLTDDLFESIDREAGESHFTNLLQAWDTWRQYLANLSAELEILRSARNPELILSFTDLLIVAASEEDSRRTLAAVHHLEQTGLAEVAPLESYFTSPGRKLVSNACEGKTNLLEALTWYFAFRHMEDYKAHRSTRDYLRRLFSPLERGDAVVTFNWDTLTERTLAEEGRWSPIDGYGFARQLTHARGPDERIPIPNGQLPVSDIVVLKLHGSFGWRALEKDIYLDAENFLKWFKWSNSNDFVSLHDAAEPAHYSPRDPVVAYPSYLKRFSHPVLMQVWLTAASHLGRAQYVEIIGYGLPASDTAAQSLFLPLAQRVHDRRVQVVVRDKSSHTLERWEKLLGPHAEFREEII